MLLSLNYKKVLTAVHLVYVINNAILDAGLTKIHATVKIVLLLPIDIPGGWREAKV